MVATHFQSTTIKKYTEIQSNYRNSIKFHNSSPWATQSKKGTNLSQKLLTLGSLTSNWAESLNLQSSPGVLNLSSPLGKSFSVQFSLLFGLFLGHNFSSLVLDEILFPQSTNGAFFGALENAVLTSLTLGNLGNSLHLSGLFLRPFLHHLHRLFLHSHHAFSHLMVFCL